MRRFLATAAIFTATILVGVPIGQAQSLGTFRWQLTPFCNIVTLNVRQDGAVYTLDGFDDQCGAGTRASLVGTAFLNPDGSIGFGLTGATAPGAAPVVLYARLDPGSVGGAWSDSAGNSGTMVLTGAASGAGSPRQVPTNGIRPGSITSNQIAAGAIGAVQIAAGSITAAQIALGSITGAHIANGTITAAQLAPGTAQPPITGQCPVGQYLRGFSPAGQVICEPLLSPTLSTTPDASANSLGYFTALAIGTDGLPVIAYHDNSAGSLRVTKCGNTSCNAGNQTTVVDDPVNFVGFYVSIAMPPDGRPVISYQDVSATTLKVAKCGNGACSTGNVITTVDDPANSVGYETSIAIPPDGLPIISHRDVTLNALRVTKCGVPSCESSNTSSTVDDQANVVGYESSIAIGTDGLAVISHQDFTAGALRVTKCGNAVCTANATVVVDDPPGTPGNVVGRFSSMEVPADGLPVISYWDQTNAALKVVKCGDVACSAGNVITTVDDQTSSVGQFGSLAIGTDGLPVISHMQGNGDALRVTKCGNTACSSNNVSTTVDDPPGIALGYYTSIGVGPDGLPAISHLDASNLDLRFTKCGTQTCR